MGGFCRRFLHHALLLTREKLRFELVISMTTRFGNNTELQVQNRSRFPIILQRSHSIEEIGRFAINGNMTDRIRPPPLKFQFSILLGHGPKFFNHEPRTLFPFGPDLVYDRAGKRHGIYQVLITRSAVPQQNANCLSLS